MNRMKFFTLLFVLFITVVGGGVLGVRARSYQYVWIADVLYPERGCSVQVFHYTLEPNPSSITMVFASTIRAATCEMHVIYTGE